MKTALRARLLSLRRDAAQAAPDAAERLADAFPDLRPAVVAGYMPIRSEIDPWPLLQRLAAAGAKIVLPRTPAKGVDAGLTFHLFDPAHPLVKSGFGVLEPPPGAPELKPDLILVPLLGFDRQGGRLGYGAGHYDRTLEALRAGKSVVAVGLAYTVQEVDALPLEPHDQFLDGIVTEAGYTEVRKE